jgi:proteasome lid subunit RPN8/RPN11
MSKQDKQNDKTAAQTEPAKVSATDWDARKKPIRRNFPGPKTVDVPLRVAIDRSAYAEVIAHAKESLQCEICGALAGDVCEDDNGTFVEVKAAIRGSAAREGTTHVTFTQETWNTIHQRLEKEFPKLQIVGWYHSHPGFGVEFSDMDRFIQKNFFPSPTQIALVTDPLGGDVAICFNSPDGIKNLPRFWVDGREHQCRANIEPPAAAGGGHASSAIGGTDVRVIEARLGQLMAAFDEQRTRFHRVLMTLFFVVGFSVVGLIGWHVYGSFASRYEPPKPFQYVPVPVQIGDQTALLGIAVVQWDLPPKLNAMLREKVRLELEMEKAAATNNAAGGTNQTTNSSSRPATPTK